MFSIESSDDIRRRRAGDHRKEHVKVSQEYSTCYSITHRLLVSHMHCIPSQINYPDVSNPCLIHSTRLAYTLRSRLQRFVKSSIEMKNTHLLDLSLLSLFEIAHPGLNMNCWNKALGSRWARECARERNMARSVKLFSSCRLSLTCHRSSHVSLSLPSVFADLTKRGPYCER